MFVLAEAHRNRESRWRQNATLRLVWTYKRNVKGRH